MSEPMWQQMVEGYMELEDGDLHEIPDGGIMPAGNKLNPLPFNEAEWLKILFLISDTEAWLKEQEKKLVYLTPLKGKNKLFGGSFFITASSLAHILERHYYKIPRHPGASKFTVSVAEILDLLRQAKSCPPAHLPDKNRCCRLLDAKRIVGFDMDGQDTRMVSVITDLGGRILTAFPGLLKLAGGWGDGGAYP